MTGAQDDILQMRLDGIARSMQEVLFRAAVSPVVREGADAACALFTPEGELMALSDAIPLLLGALPGSVRALLDAYPAAEMTDGDLFLMNDPYAGGTHLPDLCVMKPVLAEGRVVALAASLLHHQDIGGLRPGSVPPDAREIYHEGIVIPPMRLGHGGRISAEAERLIRANSRAPETVLGDLRAQIAAATRAERAIAVIAAERGAAVFLGKVAAAIDRTEAALAELLSRLPEGPHEGRDGLDPVEGVGDVEVCVALRFAGGRLTADFTGSSPQVPVPINCVRSGPLSAVLYALLALAGEGLARNGGVLRAIRLILPEASVINAARPAPVNARMGMVRATTSAVLQAVAKAVPDRMPAANSGMSYVLAFSGQDAEGAHFVSTEIIAGGAGGGPEADGADGISTDVGNAMNMSAESLEAQVPVRVRHAGIRHGSGGAGRFRGGNGIARVYEALADGIAVSLRGERFVRVPPGLDGGGSPRPSAARVERADGTVETLSARSAVTLDRGDRLVVESAGGAGAGRSEG